MTTVAITGASGFIGRALTESLRSDGVRVIEFVRSTPSGDDQARWNINDKVVDSDAIAAADAVVHLAGEPVASKRWTTEQKRRIHDSRVDGTRLIAEAIATNDSPPDVFVSGSAIGFYGDRGDTELTEDSDAGEGFLSTVCINWEKAADPARDAGVRVVHPRTGIVLDADGGALERLIPIFKFGLGGPIGNGKQWWSWITLEDEVRALRHLIESDLAGPVNLTAPHPVRQIEFADELGTQLRRPTFFPTPSFGPKLVLGEGAGPVALDSARVLPEALAESQFSFTHARIDAGMAAALD